MPTEDDDDASMPSLWPCEDTFLLSHSDSGPRWKCDWCGGLEFLALGERWRCRRCGSFDYHEAASSSFEDLSGQDRSWTWTPSDATIPPSSTTPPVFSRPMDPRPPRQQSARDESLRTNWDFGPPSEWDEQEYGARSESNMTNDPEVNPDTLQPEPHLSRRQRRAARQAGTPRPQETPRHGAPEPQIPQFPVGRSARAPRAPNGPGGPPVDPPSRGGRTLPAGSPSVGGGPRVALPGGSPPGGPPSGGGESSSSKSSWNSKKGPEPGVKFRGGTPPSPPVWAYSREDLRAFSKWERKVRVWQVQIRAYLPANEAAMALYVSLRGEAEEELEHADLASINHRDGIDFILDSLRALLMTKVIYLKRRYLHEFEQVSRFSGESVRSFCNRYARIERNLRSVQINIEAMYDMESRGSRLLDRLRLTLEQQRLILTSTGQDLDINKIREAAILQFPDHRPTPPTVFSREFEFDRRDRGAGDDSRPFQPHPKGRGKGHPKGSKGGRPRQTYVAEHARDDVPTDHNEDELPTIDEEPADCADEPNDNDNEAFEEGEEGDDLENDDGGPEEDGLQDIVDCLTVTARRLQGLTLGRKYTGKRSIQDRKRTSHCAICGERGHWQGDPECPMSKNAAPSTSSSSSKGSGKAKSKSKDAAKTAGSKKVFAVKFADGVTKETEPHETIHKEETYGTYFTFVTSSTPLCRAPSTNIPQVLMSNLTAYGGYMVLDTACQRTCCSSSWLNNHVKSLTKNRLKLKEVEEHEPFQFGHGEPQYSFKRSFIPAGLNQTPDGLCVIGTSVLDTSENNKIPLLASNYLLTHRLKAIIDLPRRQLVCQALECTIPIVQVDGHLAVRIDLFPQHVHTLPCWRHVSDSDVWNKSDSELILCSQQFDDFKERHSGTPRDATPAASTLASSMAPVGLDLPELREHSGSLHDASNPVGSSSSCLAGTSGPYERGDPHRPSGPGIEALPTSRQHDPKERESTRPVRPVPRLQHEVEVERKQAGLGRATFRKTLVAALALFGELLGGYDALFHSRSSTTGRSTTDLDGIGLDFTGASSFELSAQGPADTSSSLQHQQDGNSQAKPVQETQRGRGGRVSGSHPAGAGLRGGVRVGSGGMKNGSRTWLTGHLRHHQKIYDSEVATYEQIPNHVDIMKYNSKIDLLEIFSGSARLTTTACRYGLNALQPFDLREGIDLSTPEGRELTLHAVRHHRPLLLHVAWPCKLWSLFNENMNWSHRLADLEVLREEERVLVKFTADLCKEQHAHGRLFLGENVLRSRLWQEPIIEDLARETDADFSTCDAGAYGAESMDGFPVIKPHRWISNSPVILSELKKHLTPEQKHYTKPVEGADTQRSGEYCQGLVNAILRGLHREAKQRNPARFHKVKEVYYVRPLQDPRRWKALLDQLDRRFDNTRTRTFDLNKTDPVYEELCALVPWTIEKVQVSLTPAARRWPGFKIPFTHRGAGLKMADGRVIIESEDMSAVNYPQQRFSQPVRLGVFFFGAAPDEDEATASSSMPAPSLDSQVWSKRDLAATQLQTTKYGGPAWHTVHRRVTTNLATGELIQDLENPFQQPDRLVHKKLRPPRDIETFFYHRPMLPGGHENPGAAEDGLAAEEADGFPSSTLEDGASGAAEDGPAAEEADGFPSSTLVPGMKTDIWFDKPPPGMTSALKSSVARLHCNLGHAPKEEIARLLAASNALTPKLLSALDALRCGSCLRTARPKRPATSSTSTVYAGFFGEVLQADIVYHRLLSGEAIPVLGIVCEATNYHAAKALSSRSPQVVLETLLEIWYRPLGLPHRFRCDPDGAFQSVVAQWHATHGILHEIIPAEMHNRIGKIERRNALLRTLLERLTDEHACSTVEHLQHLIVAALYALNACTFTYGRSPFQAVFGKVPRPIGDILNDETMLIYSPDETERAYRPEILRADALKALAETSANQAVKRAILRKTRHTQDFSALQPGQTVAYWRWSGKSRQLKRGSWNLARFLAFDPDRRSCWIQVNTHTVKIAISQLRIASGWETWSPSAEDVRFLKDAEKTLQEGLWHDGTEEAPGQHEEQFADEAMDTEVRQLAPEILPRQRDYWQLSDSGATRVHVEPRHELYVPLPHHGCPLPLDMLADDRQTFVHEFEEQPEMDNWRDSRSAKTYEQAWTGATTFFKRRQPVEVASPEVSAEGTLLPSTALPPAGLRLPVPTRDEAARQAGTQVIQQQQQQNFDQRQLTINVSSPTYQQFGAPRTPVPPTPRRRTMRSRSPAPITSRAVRDHGQHTEQRALGHTSQTELNEEQRPATEPVAEPNTTTAPQHEAAAETAAAPAAASSSQPADTSMPDEPLLPEMPAKRPFDTTVMFSHRWDIFDDNTMCLKFPGFDGSPDTIGFQRCQVYMNFYLKSAQRQQEVTEGDPEVSDVDSSDQDLDVSNQKVKTRQEQKQFEKEIPWRDIMKMDRMTIDKYILAIQKEFDGWQRWSGVQPIPEAEAERIFKDRVLRRRVLKSRMAYRDKNRGVGTLAAKARCVLIGCADPDLTSLSRDSPTPSRTSEFLLLAILASGANGRFNNTPDRWHCWISDAKNAFLQGKQNTEERNGQPLYMQPPEDPLVKESGCFAAHLYLVTGNCYGLSNAPRIWYKHVCTVLSQNKFRMHDLDRCLFYHVSEATGEEKVDCVLIIHVDDVLAVYSDRFSLEILETMFEWGSVTKLDGTNEGTYRGKEIKLFEEAGEWKVKVTQKEFCKTLEPPRNLPGKMDDKLTPAGWKEFRSLAGCLQWLASQSRPPLAAVTSLSNKGSDTTFRDLKNLGEALLYARDTSSDGITIPGIVLNRSSIVLVFADSSWANATNFSSQYGVIVTLTPSQVSEAVTPCAVVDWKSGRSARVCRSTLASEACAADEGTDRGSHINAALSEILYLKPAHQLGSRMSQKQCTDCKSLYDCVIAENPAVSDRRSLLQIRSVQQSVHPHDMHWVPTTKMHADGLTKEDKRLRDALNLWLRSPWAQLRDVEPRTKTSESLDL